MGWISGERNKKLELKGLIENSVIFLKFVEVQIYVMNSKKE